MSAEKDSTFDDFVEHTAVVFSSVKRLQDIGLSRDYIVRLLRYIANFLEGLDGTDSKGK